MYARQVWRRWLVLGLLVCLVCSGTSHSVARAQQSVRSLHVGDNIPMTLYLRTQRQSSVAMGHILAWFGIGGDEAEPTLPPEEMEKELPLPSMNDGAGAGATTAKHRSQLTRSLPPPYLARYGIRTTVSLPAKHLMAATMANMVYTDDKLESDFAVRFSLGRDLRRETTWLPLALRRLESTGNHLLYIGEDTIADDDDDEEVVVVDDKANDGILRGGGDGKEDEVKLRFLHSVYFVFGYQTGLANKVTDFRVECLYSTKHRDVITLHYLWNEHRAYNTPRAFTVCSACVLFVAMLMTAVILRREGRAGKQFHEHLVVVREHEE